MATTPLLRSDHTELSIFARLLENGRRAISPQLARYILTVGFDEDDQARMTDLAARNQANDLSASEQHELMSFVKAGHLLALLHSLARKALKNKKVS